MAALEYDITVEQGALFTLRVEWREDNGTDPPSGPMLDTTDYDAYMQIRTTPARDLIGAFDSVVGGKGGITVANGTVDIRIGADVSSNFHAVKGVYDLEMHNRIDPSDVVRLLQGTVTISPDITREGA